jgi:hypothetical protein
VAGIVADLNVGFMQKKSTEGKYFFKISFGQIDVHSPSFFKSLERLLSRNGTSFIGSQLIEPARF